MMQIMISEALKEKFSVGKVKLGERSQFDWRSISESGYAQEP